MKRVFIFLHGAEKETFLRLKPKEEESIICADSGISLARKIKYSPKKVILIGDLDSVSKKDISWCKDNKINIKKYSPNKDFTDGDLALALACKKYGTKIQKVVLGGVSSVMDHTLGNIFSAIPFVNKGHKISFHTKRQRIYLIREDLIIKKTKSHVISLVPLEKIIVSTKGLQWKLQNEIIYPYKSKTLRNKAISEKVEIKISKGILLVIESW
ncbi:MAG TPA: thiamine diphosphokinase [Nanoarchaeota archaeon]|nr:thiamine diphosphokinase [Candidatus Woesearchaeota archaeon]HIH14626.1 thiamine diphosphokinase [Nanoarchaeota archaeon]HIH59186.1 thiamine diphosphokinase [Nanoarchaeota archaeon]HII13499.1 thiamine diphosphokinase [Nanoarchaeota archaeon]HIJ05588.1 thiamine diphosphokinase [Nanoarchaeota archaeon]